MLTSSFRFPCFPLPFRFLSSASVPLPATQPPVSSFPLFPLPPLSGFPGAPLRFRFLAFPVLPGLISHAFFPGSRTRLCCLFPFVLPCFAPAAVPQVIPFRISSPGPMPDFRFLSSTSVLATHYSASVSSFPLFPVPPHSCFPVARLRFRFLGFPFLSGLISHAFLPGSRTRLPVCFLSSFLASLPQLFHECLPSAFAFGLSPSDPLPFARFSSGSDYSALCFFLSALCPLRLTVGSSSRLGSLRPLRSSPSSTAGFPSASFRFCILGSLFVSFRPSLLRSHSRSTGASLLSFLSGINA